MQLISKENMPHIPDWEMGHDVIIGRLKEGDERHAAVSLGKRPDYFNIGILMPCFLAV